MFVVRALFAPAFYGLGFLAALLPTTIIRSAAATPRYEITPIAIIDLEHTRDDGFQHSRSYPLNDAGQAAGVSNRFNGTSTDFGISAWFYDGTTTLNIGFVDDEHTSDSGYRKSDALEINEAGQVRGMSNRYSGRFGTPGKSAWLYSKHTTLNIGLVDGEHTRDDGYRWSHPDRLNEAGQVIGSSARYHGGDTHLGASAWFFDGTTTTNIGLTSAEYTRDDGFQRSSAGDLNEVGYVLGVSIRYIDGTSDLGATTWVFDGATTFEIGLTGSEHTRFDGYKHSDAFSFNEAGQASGESARFLGGAVSLGKNGWFFDGANTIKVGLVGSEHTRADGYQRTEVNGLNEAGQAWGYTYRYQGGSVELGRSAWLYDGLSTGDIGFLDSEHTRQDGFRFSSPYALNESGQVLGYSQRYSGSSEHGRSTWMYDGLSTFNVGLTDDEHTRDDGYRFSAGAPKPLNESGQAVGVSQRFDGGDEDLGMSAWFFDGAMTTKIGLIGSDHTRDDGYRYSEVETLNELGQTIGYSKRYDGNAARGHDAWLYDPLLDQSFSLNLSTYSNGWALSTAEYLGDDGLALGTYRLFDEMDNDLGSRAFYFTVGDGLHDLGALVDGGLSPNGWEHLADAIRSNGLGQILGHGSRSGQTDGQVAYLLTPLVPEPATWLMALSGLVAFIARGRKSRRG